MPGPFHSMEGPDRVWPHLEEHRALPYLSSVLRKTVQRLDITTKRLHNSDLQSPLGQQQCERTCPAADIQDALREELVRHGEVCVQVAAVGMSAS